MPEEPAELKETGNGSDPSPGPVWSVRRIHKIKAINGASRYLEIGVASGKTFLKVEVDEKDAVDPEFDFDPAVHATDRVRFFEQTSNDFWTSGSAKTYDIIFIDGLHTFEQTLRDLLCSMVFSHHRTVWLIDDTVPSDVYSSLPDQARCNEERRRYGNPKDLAWHGDVYKVVPALRDFLPVLDFTTIVNSGNPQTMAWVSGRRGFSPRVNNLEAISRMDFFQIRPNFKLFNLATEDAAFARLATALQG